jgi:hypothetical protein
MRNIADTQRVQRVLNGGKCSDMNRDGTTDRVTVNRTKSKDGVKSKRITRRRSGKYDEVRNIGKYEED